jgi:hypothetical protein
VSSLARQYRARAGRVWPVPPGRDRTATEPVGRA